MPRALKPPSPIFPFGKYKGKTATEVMKRDPGYVTWIATQSWLAENFAQLHAALVLRGAAMDDTPEHNILQARFIDPHFRLATLLALRGRFPPQAARIDPDGPHGANPKPIRWDWRTFQCDARFEDKGIDVVLEYRMDARFIRKQPPEIPGADVVSDGGTVALELKPSLGDDFPSVMRQMTRLEAWVLVIGDYNGRSVPIAAVRDMFRANRRQTLFVREIEAQLPAARTLIA